MNFTKAIDNSYRFANSTKPLAENAKSTRTFDMNANKKLGMNKFLVVVFLNIVPSVVKDRPSKKQKKEQEEAEKEELDAR